jgi:allantoin racemase
MPVVGPGQSAISLALQLGDRYAVLTPLETGHKRLVPHLRALGLAERLAAVRGIGVPVVDFGSGTNDAWQRIVATARRCVSEDDADVLVMGCMSMAFMSAERELSVLVGIPVINPVLAALKAAETLLALGLSHSRTSWPSPPAKAYFD